MLNFSFKKFCPIPTNIPICTEICQKMNQKKNVIVLFNDLKFTCKQLPEEGM